MNCYKPSRRELISGAGAAAAFTFLPARVLGRGASAPSEKLNIAFIGLGCRGAIELKELSSQNVVAICDCDWRPIPNYQYRRACEMAAEYPKAKRYDDWRIMLQEQDKNIDAVVVATPDHTHAAAAITAMKMKKHVYCEKPMAHSINEINAKVAAARQYKVTTQVGNQGHSSEDCIRIVEWVRDGAIGTVKEAHLFQPGNSRGYDFIKQVTEKHEVPEGLNWDLWLGPAEARAYNPMYLPNSWRRWTNFGTGTMGDYNCHYMDPVSAALELGLPDTIEADPDPLYDPKSNRESFPSTAEMVFHFPAKGKRSEMKIYWHMGGQPPIPEGWNAKEQFPRGGGYMTGTKGTIMWGTIYASLPRAASTEGYKPVAWGTAGKIQLLPEALEKGYKRPDPTLPRPMSHWMDWVEAAKAGRQAGSHFGYGAQLSATGVLGNIACRFKGQILHFDEKTSRFRRNDEANAFLNRKYREGWQIPEIKA